MQPGECVCVTGASGYIASELIRVLLSKGLKVNGTVRSKAKASHLFNLPGATEHLTLFEADLMGDASAFTPAITGCRVVMHTACPFVYSGRASSLSEQFFVDPAVKGTESVLSVCAAVGGVERVVMTSSCAAIFKRLVPEGHVYDESTWNDPVELAQRSMWYSIGKTRQEEAAWAWMKAHAPTTFTLACINPCMVAGEALQPTLNASQESMGDFCSGAKAKVPNSNMPWCHLTDVVDAHIAAGEKKGAEGRYMIISSWVHLEETCKEIVAQFPALAPRVPTAVDIPEGGSRAPPSLFNSSKVEALLGRPLLPLSRIVKDSVSSLLQWGHVVPPGVFPPHALRVCTPPSPSDSTTPMSAMEVRFGSGLEGGEAPTPSTLPHLEGLELTPTRGAHPPLISLLQAPPTHLYTLLLTDPDAPNPSDPKFGEWQHWCVINCPGGDVTLGDTTTPYFGPAPGKEGGRHRYVLVAYHQQGGKIDTAEVNHIPPFSGFPPRRSFKSKDFAAKHSLVAVAALTFPCEYDASVPTLSAKLAPPS